ncbi:MAG: Threonylcarbamoyl-AMP synthase [Microgenomates bacterium OLB22]|nr:MAG: Threonylcarbamoyl-AMP synthase [Microgenomates bacterium OLB22]
MNTIVLDQNEHNFTALREQLRPILKAGGVVVAPTDTVYAYLVDATNQEAVDTLRKLRNLPMGKPVSVFVGSLEFANDYVEISGSAEAVMRKLLPGPYTLILPSKRQLASGVVSEKDTLGIRIPKHPWLNELVLAYGAPLTATAAGNVGSSTHLSVASFLKSLSKKKQQAISLIVDGGILSRNDPSTVIDLSTTDPIMLRSGEGRKLKEAITESAKDTEKMASELLHLTKDYAKQKPVVLLLEGHFGVGKTVMVKAIAHELGLDDVISPTFAIYYEYDVPETQSIIKKLYHFDLFRIEDAEEYSELEINSLLTPGSLIAVEWAQKSHDFIKHTSVNCTVLLVHMERLGDTTRRIEIRLLQE